MGKRPRREKTSWTPHRAVERPVRRFSFETPYRLALAYPSSYEVGMSSLGFQRVYELVHEADGWSAERFFTEGAGVGDHGMPRSVESETALAEFGCVAFSVSFEEDYVRLLELLRRAGIPWRRRDRRRGDPVVVLGGACAAINPLPMAEFVDVFALGAAENLLGDLLGALAEEEDRDGVCERLAHRPGFFVPAFHDPEREELPEKLRKLELTAEQMVSPGHLPTTAVVTKRTEFSSKFLVEMSRGCPEKCRYCWATFGMGKFRWHPTAFILDSLERGRSVTDEVGFVATAVGDHPEIGRILTEAHQAGFRSAVSSIRIPAVTDEVLAPLFASGGRSITLAPETGSDRLRWALNKPIPNELLLQKVRLIFRHGFSNLKLYFIVGLPGETMDDVEAVLTLVGDCRQILLEEGTPRGALGHIHLGLNVLIPKPYTPYQREAMEETPSLKRKVSRLQEGVASLPNVSISTMSIRQAVWQTYISRAGSDAADVLEEVARGTSVASALRRHAGRVQQEVYREFPGKLRWHFLRTG